MTAGLNLPLVVSSLRRGRGRHSGQALALLVLFLTAIISLTALIIDGGHVWAEQRVVQNGADAAAEAGAIVLAERLDGQPTPALGWDATVSARVQSVASQNGIVVLGAYYTDICGIPLKPDGTAALNLNGTMNLAVAAPVGAGIPPSSATSPDCPALVVGPPAGVLTVGRKTVPAFVAGAVGISSFTPTAQATAVSGWLTGLCDASQGEGCPATPITFPVNIVQCSGTNGVINTGDPWQKYTVYRVPLCGNAPGNVGWIDWSPPAGGTSELKDAILTRDNPPIDLPSWRYVTATGNLNSQGVQDALNTYDGRVVLFPLFDLTCNPPNNAVPDNSNPAVVTPPNYGCPAGSLGGSGQNQWYRFPTFAAFVFCSPSIAACAGHQGAYLTGNNSSVCDTGNGATTCLIGYFVDFISSGTVSAGNGGGSGATKVVGTQLIR